MFEYFISCHFDYYGLQLQMMKSPKFGVRKLEYYIISVLEDILNRNVRPL